MPILLAVSGILAYFRASSFCIASKPFAFKENLNLFLNQGIWEFVWILQLVPASDFQTKTATNILPIKVCFLFTHV